MKSDKLIEKILDTPGCVLLAILIVNIIGMIVATTQNYVANVIVSGISFIGRTIHQYLVYKHRSRGFLDYTIFAILIITFVVYIIYIFTCISF